MGTMGSGKTSVLAEASDILALRAIVHAAIDLDASAIVHLALTIDEDGLMYRNLRSVRENYAAVGVRRVLLARTMEDRAELALCRLVPSRLDPREAALDSQVGI